MEKKMKRHEIIKYFDNLKNEIDIECEKKLANSQLSNSEENDLNSMRTKFIHKIEEISAFDLRILDSCEPNNFLFDGKFCFFLQNLNFGQLVITNQFIRQFYDTLK